MESKAGPDHAAEWICSCKSSVHVFLHYYPRELTLRLPSPSVSGYVYGVRPPLRRLLIHAQQMILKTGRAAKKQEARSRAARAALQALKDEEDENEGANTVE